MKAANLQGSVSRDKTTAISGGSGGGALEEGRALTGPEALGSGGHGCWAGRTENLQGWVVPTPARVGAACCPMALQEVGIRRGDEGDWELSAHLPVNPQCCKIKG